MSYRSLDAHPYRPVLGERQVTLLCPEALRAAACCVEDALVARGWKVRLEIGDDARRGLLRARRDRTPGLKVLCVSSPVDASAAKQIRRAFDRYGTGDFQIVHMETPRRVIEAVERWGTPMFAYRRPRRFLAHPTLVEQQAVRGKRTAGTFAMAACILALFGAVGVRSQIDAVHVRSVDVPAYASRPRFDPAPMLVDASALASTHTDLPEPDAIAEDDVDESEILIFDETPAPRRRARPHVSGQLTADALEAAMLEAAPLQAETPEGEIIAALEPESVDEVVSVTAPLVHAVPPGPGELPKTKRFATIDPFATP